MSLGEKDAVHLAAMLRYLNLASSFIGEMTFDEFSDESHVQTQFAVAMAIAQVGEHMKGLSREFRSDESSVDWREIAGTRDWLVHKYDEVDLRILYGSVVNDTPHWLSCSSLFSKKTLWILDLLPCWMTLRFLCHRRKTRPYQRREIIGGSKRVTAARKARIET